MNDSVWTRMRRHRLAVASLAIFTVIAVACLAAPIIAPYDFDAISYNFV